MAAMLKKIHTRTDRIGTGVILNKMVASGMISSIHSGCSDVSGINALVKIVQWAVG